MEVFYNVDDDMAILLTGMKTGILVVFLQPPADPAQRTYAVGLTAFRVFYYACSFKFSILHTNTNTYVT
jgi:hypothetical protein